jgi:hypothetical protein
MLAVPSCSAMFAHLLSPISIPDALRSNLVGEHERLVHLGAARVDGDGAVSVLDEERLLGRVLGDDPGLVDLVGLAVGSGLGRRVVLRERRAVPNDLAAALGRCERPRLPGAATPPTSQAWPSV